MFKQEREAAAIIPDAANARIKPSYFAMSFPALNGEVVMQGHADYCAEHGHATHTVKRADGVTHFVAINCPRCGASTRDRFDMAAAWQFVLDSYDGGGYSPARRDWTDGEILAFVAEHHVDGIAAVFAAKPEQTAAETEQADDETPAPTFKVVGENTLTGNTWDCETGLTREEAVSTRRGYARLESDYKIEYRIEPQD
jgi:hypothetical protein